MAGKSDLDSFIIQCARKYADNHPNEKVSIVQKTKVPIDCAYCGNRLKLYRIPFSDVETYIDPVLKSVVVKCDCDRTQIFEINYCPKCGRKL